MAKAQAKKGAVVRTKRREKKNIEKGQVHIRSSFNNTIVTITDLKGNAISWASSGTTTSDYGYNDFNIVSTVEPGSIARVK